MNDLPVWFDSSKYHKGRQFFEDHFVSVLFSYLCALLVGFTVPSLTNALVFTGVSDGPEKSRKRYLKTLAHLILWHESDLTDTSSNACKSLNCVINMHRNAKMNMVKNGGYDLAEIFTQHDFSLVQSGFIGPIVMYPKLLGVYCPKETIEDYIHFWRVVGFLIGINDDNNVCTDYETTRNVCVTVEQTVIVPGLQDRTAIYEQLSLDFMNGIECVIPFLSRNIVFAFVLPFMGLQKPKLSLWENLVLYGLKGYFLFVGHFKWSRIIMNRRVRKVVQPIVEMVLLGFD